MGRIDPVMFITLLLRPRLTIAQAWTTSCTSERRGELASVQGPGPTEGADRKEQRKTGREERRWTKGREKEREVARGRLVLARYSILYLSHSLIPSSSCTVHSFGAPTSRCLSLPLSCARARLRASSRSIPHFPLRLTRARKHARSFISSLSN